MQTEVVEKRRWISKQKFLEGLSVVNILPGPIAAQLAIFVGHARAGMAGGVAAGVCFILPGLAIILALSTAYGLFGALPAMRDAFYGIGPVVLGIFATAVYRLGKVSIKEFFQVLIALAAALAIFAARLDLAAAMLIAGCLGVAQFHSRRSGLIALVILVSFYLLVQQLDLVAASLWPYAGSKSGLSPTLSQLALFFFEIGALTFGGGLSILAFMEQWVVTQLGWLTPQEFVDGLAIGQLTPGPVLMLAAFVGYKLLGIKGGAIAAAAVFLPSFLMMLAILPMLKRFNELQWLKASMRGIGPAVIGVLASSLVQIVPQAAFDPLTIVLLSATCALMLFRNIGPLPLISVGAGIGIAAGGSVQEWSWLFERFE